MGVRDELHPALLQAYHELAPGGEGRATSRDGSKTFFHIFFRLSASTVFFSHYFFIIFHYCKPPSLHRLKFRQNEKTKTPYFISFFINVKKIKTFSKLFLKPDELCYSIVHQFWLGFFDGSDTGGLRGSWPKTEFLLLFPLDIIHGTLFVNPEYQPWAGDHVGRW